MTGQRVSQSRLTAADKADMTSRVAERVVQVRRDSPGYRWNAEGQAGLIRLACHAVGCSTADMRDVELTEIGDLCRSIINEVYAS